MNRVTNGLLSLVFCWVGSFCFYAGAVCQTPGPAFRVNTYTAGGQSMPSVAIDGYGNAVIAWVSYYGSAICAQRYDASLVPLGSEFLVNSTTTGCNDHPDVAASSNGEFVIAWRSEPAGSYCYCSYYQRFDGSGSPVGPEMHLPEGTDQHRPPQVVMSDSGEFLVIDGEPFYQRDNGYFFGRDFDANGDPCSPGWLQVTGEHPNGPAVAGNKAGDYLCLWSEWRYFDDDATWGFTGQVCGTKTPPVKLFPFYFGGGFDVALRSNGDMLLVRVVPSGTASAKDIVAQWYDPSFNPLGAELKVKTAISASLSCIAVAALDDGDFLVVWERKAGDFGPWDVFARRYRHIGETFLDEFQVNTPGHPGSHAVVAASPAGGFLIAWYQDSDVYARELPPIPTAVTYNGLNAPRSNRVHIHPNPFSHSTTIDYHLKQPAEVIIRIYNVRGMLVASIPQGRRPEGQHEATWNGTDVKGKRVHSGTYFCELSTGSGVASKKMIVLR